MSRFTTTYHLDEQGLEALESKAQGVLGCRDYQALGRFLLGYCLEYRPHKRTAPGSNCVDISWQSWYECFANAPRSARVVIGEQCSILPACDRLWETLQLKPRYRRAELLCWTGKVVRRNRPALETHRRERLRHENCERGEKGE